MEKNQAPPAVATEVSPAVRIIKRAGRMLVFFLTAGYAYPNVWIEGLDPTAIQAKTEGDLYKNKKK